MSEQQQKLRTIWNYRKPSKKLNIYRHANLDHSDETEVDELFQKTGVTHRIDLRSPFEILKSKHTIPPPVKPTYMAKRFGAGKPGDPTKGQDVGKSLATAVTSQMRPLDVFKANRQRKKETEKLVYHQTQLSKGRRLEMYNVNFLTMKYVDNAVWDICSKAEKMKMLSYMLTFRFTKLLQFVSQKLGTGGLLGSYQGFIDHSGEAISSALKIITTALNEGGVADYNCQFGKDRTGIITALVRYVAGDDEDDIFDDYSLSEKMLSPLMVYMDEEFVKQGLPADFAKTPRRTMADTFAYIRHKYGSIEGYLDTIGYDILWRKKLRDCTD